MEHTHIVHAGDLSRYADTRDSQGVIPELVYHLVRQSVPDATACRIPYGDAVNQPGFDGLVETESGYYEFVPAGSSYWEIGTGHNPQEKASDEFRKRTKKLTDEEIAESSFVFVTPRSVGTNGWEEPKQTAWIKRRRHKRWRRILIIDGIKLADWLREFPALGRWMAKKAGLTSNLGGIITPLEHWDLISEGDRSDPPLPAGLFTASRTAACDALEAVFNGESRRLFLFAESEHDVDDFIAAYLSGLEEYQATEFANRCLMIRDEDAWRSVAELRRPHVLVACPRLCLDGERKDLQAVATKNGHSVIIPLCGAWSGDNPEIIKLRSPSASQIEDILRNAGYPDIRARELGGIGGNRISALRRFLLGLGTLPPYATWATARLLAQAGLAGQWDADNPADIAAMEELLGKDYGEWIETLRDDALRSDSPLIQTDEKWRLVARGEAWSALGNRITDEDLDRLRKLAITVLGERDPQFDLPKDKRFAANIYGKALRHSPLLRKGIAESLALLGSRSQALSSCSHSRAEGTATFVVRSLLRGAGWERWASLNSLLPLLAEAAPDEFLDSVESVLVDLPTAPFHEIFSQEGSGGIGGRNYMTGLLWALETLAWNADYLSRVSVILADIASIDPGGSWLNRPANSLVDIFLPWHVQTTAPFDKRKTAVEAILREQPQVGWNLVLALLPHNHGITHGCHRPTWREFIPRNWKDGIQRSEYWQQIAAFTEFAIDLATDDLEKLGELIKRLPDLPESAREKILDHLASANTTSLPEIDRLSLWERLDELVRVHRKFADADWVLAEGVLRKVAETASALAPSTPELKYRRLFSGRNMDLYEEKGNYDEQRAKLDRTRQAAVKEILETGGLRSVLNFADHVAAPLEVGRSLAGVDSDDLEDDILPRYLNTESATLRRVVSGFTWARFWQLKWPWVDEMLAKEWTAEEKASFLTLLPFEEKVWERVTELGAENERLYWGAAHVNPYGEDRELNVAIEKLLEHGRAVDAVMCAARSKDDPVRFNHRLATRALLSVLAVPKDVEKLDNYATVELIAHLQDYPEADEDALFRIEWNFLPWLGRLSAGSPKTLERRLSRDPTFFAEAVALVFRSKHAETKEPKRDEQERNLARAAYTLLTEWRRCPGVQDDDSFDVQSFNTWIEEARRITEETGHAEVAQIQIGHVLTCAPADPGGLWIHDAVAKVLNYRDAAEMRSGFTTQLFNQRGVHGFTGGREERKLAKQNREKAEALDVKGHTRFAAAMREFAEQYDRQAEREEKRESFGD